MNAKTIISNFVLVVGVLLMGFGLGEMINQKTNDTKLKKMQTCVVRTDGYGHTSFSSLYQLEFDDEVQKRLEEKKRYIWNTKPILNPPVDPPPSRIIAGDLIFQIKYTSEKALHVHNALSETEPSLRLIWLNPTRVGDLRSDLWHEMLHIAGVMPTHGEWNPDNYWHGGEETAIERISPGLLTMVRDNPDTMKWLERK